ncbi:MAG: DNA recombination protein RmuC [Ruminococcus sp.]|nr:DNA recombination protein RmuC [Ruminococcus sp.]
MEIIILILTLVAIALCVLVLLKLNTIDKSSSDTDYSVQLQQLSAKLDEQSKRTLDEQSRLRTEINGSVTSSVSRLGDSLRDEQTRQRQTLEARIKALEGELDKIRLETLQTLEKIRAENQASMERIRKENSESLDKINGTVNEKLQKTLDDKISRSFEAVNKRLTEVYEGLGEMKNVASGVTDLKNVLSNVKTRGIMGEIALGSILNEILAPEQYVEQAPVAPGAKERVDFAVRLPGAEDGESIYLPIDSKFPGDCYANLNDAYESGDAEQIKKCRSLLEKEIKSFAKSIHDKYIVPPYTTDFAVMFLPFEGLYAEVVNMGLVETLQNLYKVNIAGPSTMAAMLNSLQMGFRTLAIQKKSGEVWKILEAAKKEFSQFEVVLNKTRDRLRQADEELDKLVGTRTRAINRKLKDVATIDSTQTAVELIGIDDGE